MPPGCLVLPGLVNAHTHAHNNLFKGLGDNWTLEDLLNHGPALNGNRTPEDHYLSAAIGAVEMLKNGCTAAYDLFMAAPAPTAEDIEAGRCGPIPTWACGR
jgi:cytosine/adenosine deaminase-related metal-dependent hydrolase